MTIAFFHNEKAFLPEIDAYIEYFKKKDIQCVVIHPNQNSYVDFDIEWHFMGIGKRRKKNSILVHEYGSLSVPPLVLLKDFYKKKFNEKPDFRIYLNETIKNSLNFSDNIPFGLRNMGIDPTWEPSSDIEKIYDFIYIGSSAKNRKLNDMLDSFAFGKMNPFKLLVISNNYNSLQLKYSSFHNILFKGPITRKEVLENLRMSTYGINFIPNIYPFNIQPSTKFLEYCQVKIPVITTDYKWIRSFNKDYGGKYFYLKNDLSNFDMDMINSFSFAFPDLSNWSWEQQIENSGILNFLLSI